MNKLITCISILLLVLCITTTNATPSYVNVGDLIQGTSYNPLNHAGEFTFYDWDTGYEWQSFCLEINSGIPEFSYVGGLSNYAIPGGAGGVTSLGDPISDFTAWLYASSQLDTLFGYDGSNTEAYDLQNLIWFEEEELSTEAIYLDIAQVTQWRDLFALSGWQNNGRVQVVNLYADQLFKLPAQDQLILTPAVPEPSTLLLLGIGLLWASAIGRKRIKTL